MISEHAIADTMVSGHTVLGQNKLKLKQNQPVSE